MSALAIFTHALLRFILLFIHSLYGLKNLIWSFFPSRNPKSLVARRRKTPGHVTVVFVPDRENHETGLEEKAMQKSVERCVRWCKAVGIAKLSVYERDGITPPASLYASSVNSSAPSQPPGTTATTTALPAVARKPLTPPSSDTDDSPRRPLSPELGLDVQEPVEESPLLEPARTLASTIDTFEVSYSLDDEPSEKMSRRRRQSLTQPPSHSHPTSLTVQFLSRESSRPSLALVTRALARKQAASVASKKLLSIPPSKNNNKDSELTVEGLNRILEIESGYTPPDLIIVYHLYPSAAPLEMHGYPPWHMRLSEVYHAKRRGGIFAQILRFFLSAKRRHLSSIPLPLSEVEFRRALDEYGDAEFRLGK